jgi:hypothetical protein
MSEFFVLVAHYLKALLALLPPGGVIAVVAESLTIKQQQAVITTILSHLGLPIRAPPRSPRAKAIYSERPDRRCV